MYWADELAASAGGPQVVNDSKTPSGTIHVGALRGVVIHDAIARALRAAGHETRLLFGIDDLDPMDSQTLATREGRLDDMGRPLCRIAPPAGSDAPSWARHFARQFLDTFAHVGAHPELYWMSELYRQGVFDAFIAEALDRAAEVRRVYADVSRSIKPPDWYPFQVICPDCGRVGTTRVTGWDGSEVKYTCLPDLVEWATGCGRSGSISPFGGNGKLPWNLDWVAQWRHFGVTIEGCGKDLATAGGSRDRSDALARRVFGFEPPRNVPYEFLTIGGRKMKSSAGTGAAAHEMADLLPGELLRFLMLRFRPNHAIEFDPAGETIVRLFDEFDRVARAAAGREVKGELPPDPDRIFRASLLDPDVDPAAEGARFRPAFGHLAFLIQVPEADVRARMEAEKGTPLDAAESALLDERVGVARAWLDAFAPERARIVIHRDALPAEAAALGEEQRLFLGALALRAAEDEPRSGDAWQALIFAVVQDAAIPAARAFAAIYLALLGRTNGPRAGWLLASLELDFAVGRLREVAGWGPDDGGPGPVRVHTAARSTEEAP
ncbi:MAG: lysine--tRNA ligase [Chloroflexi bacterium GWC2_73_18]|nr:MAG: lysine--tRNA ligase [Chloroflexi bacterium GWC2_73_18]